MTTRILGREGTRIFRKEPASLQTNRLCSRFNAAILISDHKFQYTFLRPRKRPKTMGIILPITSVRSSTDNDLADDLWSLLERIGSLKGLFNNQPCKIGDF